MTWEEEDKINNQRNYVESIESKIFNIRISAIAYMIASIVFIILAYIFVYGEGIIIDYVLSVALIIAFIVFSYVDIIKYFFLSKELVKENLTLLKLTETDSEKLKRVRLSKYDKIKNELNIA